MDLSLSLSEPGGCGIKSLSFFDLDNRSLIDALAALKLASLFSNITDFAPEIPWHPERAHELFTIGEISEKDSEDVGLPAGLSGLFFDSEQFTIMIDIFKNKQILNMVWIINFLLSLNFSAIIIASTDQRIKKNKI